MIAGSLPPIDATTSLLIVSPHPDDETLCCAGVIRRVVTAGGHVSVVWITSGDGSKLSMLLVEKSLFNPRDKARDLAAKRVAEEQTSGGSRCDEGGLYVAPRLIPPTRTLII